MNVEGRSGGLWAALMAAVVVLSANGCGDDGGPQQPDFVVALRKWESRGPADYTFDYVRTTCLCAMQTRVLRVEVRENEVVRVTLAGTEQELSEEERAGIPTIDDLFDLIGEAIDQGVALLDASYDDLLGYPVNVFIDRTRSATDDQLNFTVSNFRS